MPTLLQSRPVAVQPAPRRRRRVPLRLIAAGAGAAVLVPVGMQVAGWLPDDPFGRDVVDRSTTPLLLALQDLDEYHAATGTFQVVVDREVDTRYVPSVISGERVQLLATGTADAYVDFGTLDDGAVTLSSDGTTATIELPAPRLDEVRIDRDESRVLDRDRGLLDRIGDALEDDPVTTPRCTPWPRTGWPQPRTRATCASGRRPTRAPCSRGWRPRSASTKSRSASRRPPTATARGHRYR